MTRIRAEELRRHFAVFQPAAPLRAVLVTVGDGGEYVTNDIPVLGIIVRPDVDDSMDDDEVVGIRPRELAFNLLLWVDGGGVREFDTFKDDWDYSDYRFRLIVGSAGAPVAWWSNSVDEAVRIIRARLSEPSPFDSPAPAT